MSVLTGALRVLNDILHVEPFACLVTPILNICGCMHAVIEENHLLCAESVGLRKYAVKSDVFNAL